MKIEYDDNKSKSNKEKHGIDFEESKKIFEDKFLIIYPTKHTEEERFFVTGLIDKKFYTLIITFRNLNIRIISTRRAREKEIELKDEKDNS